MVDTGTGQGVRINIQGGKKINDSSLPPCNHFSRHFSFSGRESVEEKICKNLRYNLDQLKISGEREAYMRIVDSLLVGPEIIRKVNIVNRVNRNRDKVLWGKVHLTQGFFGTIQDNQQFILKCGFPFHY